ncbi:ElyC/SanA/YdcF family protein [Pelagicoccus enzymogenes]|uniref:SanA/YdcF family protein n=1 Tax=Pelagicoccus enzymogenes TaxID=2773457 RepID=UPI00280E0D4E|nr:ElyC/SanA/YdcF family protein [Pelagicoccus enzymogenes]MDQ8198325.1 ElyC/SanA/YdcF family protein [Pelagicoccus enzymogenes]
MTRLKKFALLSSGLLLAGIASTLVARAMIERKAHGHVYNELAKLPFCETAVVLGCSSTLSDGRANAFFQNRIKKAAELYHSSRVRKLIVSGDNSRTHYNEPADMKDALIKNGVPEADIVCDYAGFSTLDSMVRAREVFGQTQFIVVSQEFHNKRAVYIARSKGFEAYGLNAADVSVAHSTKTLLREELARIKSVIDVWILKRNPKFLGPTIKI